MSRPGTRAKSVGITIARLIAQGDVGAARELSRPHYSATEARAIAGASRHAKKKYGANVRFEDFLSTLRRVR